MLDMIDDENVKRAFRRLQLETKLLLKRRKNRGGISIGRRGACTIRRRDRPTWRECKFEIPIASEASPIDHGPTDLIDEIHGKQRKGHAAKFNAACPLCQ